MELLNFKMALTKSIVGQLSTCLLVNPGGFFKFSLSGKLNFYASLCVSPPPGY